MSPSLFTAEACPGDTTRTAEGQRWLIFESGTRTPGRRATGEGAHPGRPEHVRGGGGQDDVDSTYTGNDWGMTIHITRQHHVHRVYVLDRDGHPVGVLSTTDICVYLAKTLGRKSSK